MYSKCYYDRIWQERNTEHGGHKAHGRTETEIMTSHLQNRRVAIVSNVNDAQRRQSTTAVFVHVECGSNGEA